MNRNDLNAIIAEGDARVLVTQAEELGEQLARARLSTSQIRNIFGTVRRIEMNWPEVPQGDADQERARKARRELLLLKPKMAYQAKRESGRAVGDLTSVLSDGIDLVGDDRTRFQHFVDFFEAILAYHKAHGGR
jgi:CRISPR-associated protein Csm2